MRPTHEMNSASSKPSTPIDWWDAWQMSRTFQSESDFIRLLGSTWECRRQQLLDQSARRHDLEQSTHVSNQLNGLLDRMINDWWLVKQIQVSSFQFGELPHLVELTPKGRLAFSLLDKHSPRLGFEALRTRYFNSQRVYLVLETQDILTMAGYQVELLPPAIPLTMGAPFKPDLLARRGDSPIGVQVDRETKYKNAADRDRKWRRALSANQGQIYVVADTAIAMFHLLAEIRAMRFSQPGVLHLTNLEQVNTVWAQQQTIWIVEEPLQ